MHNKIRIFYSYSHTDEEARKALETHLSIMKRQDLIEEWHDRNILSGSDWEKEIDFNIEKADIILILISPDFVASDYCYGKELSRALSLHESGSATVVPLIIRPVDWQDTILGKLQALPKDGKPVTTWVNNDEAWLDIAKGLKKVVKKIASRKPMPKERTNSVMMHDIMVEELTRIQSIMDKKEKVSGLPTGFEILDQMIDGLHKEDMMLVAGRPSMGATDFALGIVSSLSVNRHLPVVIFSMRLTPNHILRRLLSSESEIPMNRILRGELYKKDLARLTRASGSLSQANILIESHQIITVAEIAKIIENISKSNELGLLIIDGVEFITNTKKHQNRNDEISAIARDLKFIAHTQKIPIIVTVNTSREAELRLNKRPLMADLNEWEILAENAANIVLLLYRDEVYNQNREDNKGIAEIIVAKNDYGPISTVELAYIESHFSFRNLYYEE